MHRTGLWRPVATALAIGAAVGSLGRVLVAANGRTVYELSADTSGTPTCTGGRAALWSLRRRRPRAVGWRLGSPAATSGGSPETAALVSRGHTVGQVVVDEGGHPWIAMEVASPGFGDGDVRCVAVDPGGTITPVGTFWVSGGRGTWAAALPSGFVVASAEVLTDTTRVVGRAELRD